MGQSSIDYAFLTGIDLLFLPAYSPTLNPFEGVWKITKNMQPITGFSGC